MFENIWTKIKHIIQGNWYNLTNQKKSLYKQRSTICYECPSVERFGSIYYCSICGCPIKTLTRVKEEHCHKGKW